MVVRRREAANVRDDDPGWPLSWRTFLWLLVPRLGLQRQIRRAADGEVDGLLLLRQVFLTFTLALAMFGVVLAVLYPSSKPPRDPATALVIGLLVLGVVGLVLGMRIEKPLDCTDDLRLATTYRQRFFLRIAFAEAAALYGFVGYFLISAWWPYPVGVATAAIGFTRAAPTSRHLARDQELLNERQCHRVLVRAIRGSRPPPAGTG